MRINKIIFTSLILGIFFILGLFPTKKTFAQFSDPERQAAYENYFECLGPSMTAYLLALLNAQQSGLIPSNVNILSPAFNMTSAAFPTLFDSLQSVLGNPNLGGIAGNIYNTGPSFDQSIMGYIQNQGISSITGPVYITESGNHSSFEGGTLQNLIDQIRQVQQTYPNIQLSLFNPFGTNPGFPDYRYEDSELRTLCDQVDCSRIGVNLASVYNDGDFERIESFGFGYAVVIIDEQRTNVNALANAINNYNGQVILRLGVGSESLGFDDPASLISFINRLDAAVDPSKIFNVIGGPNEPEEGEAWLNPACLIYILPYLNNTDLFCPFQTEGPPVFYRPEVVGHNREKPWSLWSTIADYDPNADVSNLANVLTANFSISSPSYDHDDFELVSRQMTGALQTNTDLYYVERSRIYDPATKVLDNRINIPLFNSIHKGTTIPATYGIPSQPVYDESSGETREEYLNRMLKKSLNSNNGDEDGEEFGYLADMPALTFRACIQRATCDPSREECLRIEPNSGYCTEDDEPDDCIGKGYTFSLNGYMQHQEPADLHSISRAYGISKMMLVDRPNQRLTYEDIFSPSDIEMSMALSDPYYQPSALTQAKYPDISFFHENTSLATLTNDKKTEAEVIDNSNKIAEIARATAPTAAYAETPGAQPTITFGVNPTPINGNTFEFHYQMCIKHEVGSNCSIRDVTGFVNGVETFLTPSTTTSYKCYGPGDGNMPNIVAELTPGGACTSITYGILGGRVGPEGCIDRTGTLSCDICMGADGNITQSCGNIPPPPPVDCRVCPSWAPADICPPVVAQQSIYETECTGGACVTNNYKVERDIAWVPFSGDKTNEYSVNYQEEAQQNSPFAQVLRPIVEAVSGFIARAGLQCDTETYVVNPEDPEEFQQIEEGDLYCTLGAKDYLVYAYPTSYEGDFKYKSVDMALHNAMFRATNYTDAYFIGKSTMQEVNLKLGISGIKASGGANELAFRPPTQDPLSNLWDYISGGKKREYYMAINGSDQRVMYIEYYEFYQPQISGHCLKLRALSHPIEGREVPENQNELCSETDFWVTGRPSTMAEMMNSTFAKREEEYARIAMEKGLLKPDKNTAYINIDRDILPVAEKINEIETLNTISKTKSKGKTLTYQQQQELLKGLDDDMTILVRKYSKKYSPEVIKHPNKWPEDMIKELEVIVKKYTEKFDLT